MNLTDAELILDLQAKIERLSNRVVELEQTNSRLSRSSYLLEERNQELDDFSHIASHDLQAPLRGISNLAEWLVKDLEGQLPAENKHQLELIQSRVIQMNTLINGLLQYARVGRENVDSMSIDLNQLLAEIVAMLEPPANFTIDFPKNLPSIETQGLLLKQVLSNLIGNAIKYTERDSSRVQILVDDREHWWEFTVIDNGAGIAPENQKKIFGVFQTLVGRDDLKGTGIGLAIVKKIVESQGGAIRVESELGKGSTFSFTWAKTC